MTADPIPAPMVQLPADKVEALRQQTLGWTGVKGFPLLTAARAVVAAVDAATPAASVPAADIPRPSAEAIERLVDAAPNITPGLVERMQHMIRQLEKAIRGPADRDTYAAWLRTILRTAHQETWDEGVVGEFLRGEIDSTVGVAAAEQADKGEAADTPRDEYDAHLGTTIAPAAPVGEPRTWEASMAGWRCSLCGGILHGPIDAISDAAHAKVCHPSNAPVPVNDEAEAAWQAYKAHPVPDDYRANRKSFLAGFRAAREQEAK